MDITVIISTRNHAESLGRTLESFRVVEIPAGATVEIVVVDNASTDGTAAVAETHRLGGFSLHYILEPRPGKMWAQNRGLSAAQGTILLTTDDDVIPSEDWLVRMTGPLFKGKHDALVGQIELAPHLLRPWMTNMHKHWLAVPGAISGWPVVLVGASMGFHRDVLKRVPAFDVELGPGALGFADDTLFSWQLEEAGFRIGQAVDAKVVHHFNAGRLSKEGWMKTARDMGRTEAYLLHHWHHRELKWAWLQSLMLAAKLRARRRLQRPLPDREGAPLWELSYVSHIEKCRQYNIERKRVRNYERRGLIKRSNSAIP